MTSSPSLDVLVLAGGISHERDVSLRSGRRVADALAGAGHRVTVREPDGKLIEGLAEHRPDVVWPALHGASGEDGALRSLLRAMGFPYVGSDSQSSRLAWFKPTAKTLAERAGFRTPEAMVLPRETFRELGAPGMLETVVQAIGLPLVVKPAQGGSAQGVRIVRHADDLPRAMVDAYKYSEVVLVEELAVGTELALGVVESGGREVVLPAVEIVPRSGDYSFEARYNAGETRFYTPARISEEAATRAAEAALAIHRLLGLRHLSRIDFILDAAGEPVFLEANVLPGLTETSLLPLAIEAAGRTLGEVCSELAHLAVSPAPATGE